MKYTKDYLEKLVKESNCIWELIDKIQIKRQGGNFNYLSRLITKYNINTDHFVNQYIKLRNRRSLDEILVKGDFNTINGNSLKRKLYKAGLKQPICEICGQDENWCGNKISLILDHKNGDRDNNELQNLRIVCPNCNATLDTHCGKNIKKEKISVQKLPNKFPKLTIESLKFKILENNIDFTKRGWRLEIAKILDVTPQYAGSFVKKYMFEIYNGAWKHKF
jgi:hypothetical protein